MQNPRLSDILDEYLAMRANRLAWPTAKNEAVVLRRFVANVGDIQIRHLTPQHVEHWFYGPSGVMAEHTTRDGQRRQPIAPSTHNHYRTRLSEFFKYLAKRGLTRADLLQEVQPQRLEIKQRLQPGRDMLWAMLDNAECPRNRAILATFMNTGLRASEVCDLRVGDVDFDAMSLHVRITKSRCEDDLPLTTDLADELRRWLTAYRTECIEFDRPVAVSVNHYLFPARTGVRYRWRTIDDGVREQYQAPSTWQPDKRLQKVERIVQAALRSVGLPTSHEGGHTLRRAIARIYFDDLCACGEWDSALRMTSALLHHSNTSTTERYLGLDKDRKARDLSLRGRSLLGPRPTPVNVTAIRRDGRQGQAGNGRENGCTAL